MKNIQNTILENIQNNKIKIVPKWHFVLKAFLIFFSIVFIFLLAIFFFSFVIFKNRMLPPHDMRDIVSNLEILPWILLTILFFIFTIVFLLHTKYSFTYKKPTYVIIFILFAVVFASGFIADNFKMHDRVKGRMERRPIPGMREMYRENKKDFNRGVKEKIINY